MTYENRKDIPQKYTWDLTAIYKKEDEFFAELETAKALIAKVPQFRGTESRWVVKNGWLRLWVPAAVRFLAQI